MTILQKNPISISAPFFYHFCSNSLLPLTETLVKESIVEVHFVSELDNLLGGIGSLTQNENNRCSVI